MEGIWDDVKAVFDDGSIFPAATAEALDQRATNIGQRLISRLVEISDDSWLDDGDAKVTSYVYKEVKFPAKFSWKSLAGNVAGGLAIDLALQFIGDALRFIQQVADMSFEIERGEELIHNRMFFPTDATHLIFDYEVDGDVVHDPDTSYFLDIWGQATDSAGSVRLPLRTLTFSNAWVEEHRRNFVVEVPAGPARQRSAVWSAVPQLAQRRPRAADHGRQLSVHDRY